MQLKRHFIDPFSVQCKHITCTLYMYNAQHNNQDICTLKLNKKCNAKDDKVLEKYNILDNLLYCRFLIFKINL